MSTPKAGRPASIRSASASSGEAANASPSWSWVIAAMMHTHVGDHPSLRREICRIDAPANFKGADVISEERLKKGRRVGAVEAQASAPAPVDPPGAGGDNVILIGDFTHAAIYRT